MPDLLFFLGVDILADLSLDLEDRSDFDDPLDPLDPLQERFCFLEDFFFALSDRVPPPLEDAWDRSDFGDFCEERMEMLRRMPSASVARCRDRAVVAVTTDTLRGGEEEEEIPRFDFFLDRLEEEVDRLDDGLLLFLLFFKEGLLFRLLRLLLRISVDFSWTFFSVSDALAFSAFWTAAF